MRFITSDLHLGNLRVIEYCKRPFLNVEEMNKTLIDNWNKTINNNDIVYFLGDLGYDDEESKPAEYWLKQLNGNIIFIKGNHDITNKNKLHDTYNLKYKGYNFLLIHDVDNVPENWNDWVIYGHFHNSNLEKYPFIDIKNKRINIGIDLTDFYPINMNNLIKKIRFKGGKNE